MNPRGDINLGLVQGFREALGVGVEFFEEILELRAMIHVYDVAEFMNDHMAKQVGGQKEKRGIQGDTTRGRAASPDGSLKSKTNLGGTFHADFIGHFIDVVG